MKRLPVIYALIISMVLTGCQGTAAMSEAPAATPTATPTPTPTPTLEPTPTPEPTLDDIWAELESQYPTVTYEDIQTGDYAGQHVCIEGIVDDVIEMQNRRYFDIYYPTESAYELDVDIIYTIDELAFSQAEGMQAGDIVKLCKLIHENGTLNESKTIAMKIIGSTSVEEVVATFESSYKDSCGSMDYRAVLRNPDDYESSRFKIEGRVIQVITESDTFISLLLETSGGDIIYVFYVIDEEKRSGRILEDDMITVYGYLSELYSYTNLLGVEKTVPFIYTVFIDQ